MKKKKKKGHLKLAFNVGGEPVEIAEDKLSFKSWIEWADFGFEDQRKPRLHDSGIANDNVGEDPINPIDCEVIMKELYSFPPLGNKKSRWTWADVMEWGEQAGAIKVDISPLGSYKIITRRLVVDLEGQLRWVCKSIFPLNENNHNKNEIPLAHEIYETIQKADMEMLDSAQPEYPDFKRLAYRMNTAVQRTHPTVMLYQGIKELDENYYVIFLEFRGSGVEAPTRARAEQFNVRVFFDKKIGLVRIWGHDIDSDMRRHNWEPQPSEWDEYFAPTQPIAEIVEANLRMLMTY